MTINSENTYDASDARNSGTAYWAGNTGLNTPESAASGSPYPASPGSDAITGSAYTGRPAGTSADKWNMEKLNDVYSRASRWVKANPALVISAAAGILTGVAGVIALGRPGSKAPADRYPGGESYGQPYGQGEISYNPATQTESYNPGSGSTSGL